MANPALRRPDMPPPQPAETKKVSDVVPIAAPALRLRASSGEFGDRIFYFFMLVCGLAVLATLALIVYELVLRSGPSWHAFGFKFFGGHDWDPVNEKFGAMPFVYGTLVSSFLALIIAVPLSVGVAVFTTEMCPPVASRAAFLLRGIVGCNSQRGLRSVGDFCAGTDPQQLCGAFLIENPGLDGIV